MSTQAVGQDLMSLLKMFTSPRMGPFENTNTTTLFPPNSDQARQQSDPSRMGGEPPPGGGGGGPPPGFPSPVARRVIPPDGGQQAATVPAADVPAPGAAPIAGTGKPAGTAEGDLGTFMESQPDYIAYLAQLRRRQAEARQEQATQNMLGGLVDFARARSGAPGGESGSKVVEVPTGDLTLGQFGEFQKRKEGIESEAAEKKRIDTIVADPRMKGVTREVLDSLRHNDPKKYAELVKDYFSGETETFTDPTTGTVYSRPKRGEAGAKPTVILESPETREKAAAALEATKAGTLKTEQDTSKSKTDEMKVVQDIMQGRIDPSLQSPETLKVIAKQLAMDPNDPKVLKTLAGMSPTQLQETFKTTTTAAAGRNDPREWEGTEIKEKQAGRTKLNNSLGQIPTYENLQTLLAKQPRQGSASADFINSYYRNINTILGSPLDEKTLAADQFNAQVSSLVRNAIKDYGANPSNSDRIAAGQEFGANVPPEVAKAQLGLVLKAKVWDVARHNADIQDRIDNTDMSSGNKAALKAQMVKMPAVSDQTLRAMNIPPGEVAVLKSTIGTPDEAEARATFEQRHGRMLGDWALGELKQ